MSCEQRSKFDLRGPWSPTGGTVQVREWTDLVSAGIKVMPSIVAQTWGEEAALQYEKAIRSNSK